MATNTVNVEELKPHKKVKFWAEAKRQPFLLISSALLLIYGIIFYYVPVLGWVTAFQDYKPAVGFLKSKWVGFAKFQKLFENKTFYLAFRNTLCMGVINLVFHFVTAIAFALLLNEVRIVFAKKFVQTISYMPHFLSWIIVTAIVRDILASDGIVNEFLMNVCGKEMAIDFFAVKGYFWWIVAFSNVWKETGWNAIIYLAAITAIDPCLYEAADMDGASRFQKMWYITLPSLRPTIMILLLINIGNVFQK